MSKAFDAFNSKDPKIVSFKRNGDLAGKGSLHALINLHPFLPVEKLRGLEGLPVLFTIKKNAYLGLHKVLSDLYLSLKLSYIPSKDRSESIKKLETAPPSPHLNILCYKAYLLFGTAEKFAHFIKTCGRQSHSKASPIVHLESIKFPPMQSWSRVDFQNWGDAFIQCGVDDVKDRFAKMGEYISPVRNMNGRISLWRTEFNWIARKAADVLSPDHINTLIDLGIHFGKQPEEFSRIMDYSTIPKEPFRLPLFMQLPAIIIDGARFDLPGTLFRKLSVDDPRLPYLGDYTDCCERVTDTVNNLEHNIAHAFRGENSAYYVVERGSDVLCHSWAWRGKAGELVFDGFESRMEKFTLYDLKRLLGNIARETRREHLRPFQINGVLLGVCASHLTPKDDYRRMIHVQNIKPQELEKYGMTQTMGLTLIEPYKHQPAFLPNLKP